MLPAGGSGVLTVRVGSSRQGGEGSGLQVEGATAKVREGGKERDHVHNICARRRGDLAESAVKRRPNARIEELQQTREGVHDVIVLV